MNIAEDRAKDSSLVSVRLDLSSHNGEPQEAKLIFGESQEDCVSASIQPPPDIWDRCCNWYQHLEAMWHVEEAGLEHWQRRHQDLAAETGKLVRTSLFPGALDERLVEELKRRGSGLLLVEICTDHEQLDCLPLELLGQLDWGTGTQTVVWRRRIGGVDRKPVLRLLVARSAPKDVSLPQNEEEVDAISTYIAGHIGQGVRPSVLHNSTYDEFMRENHDFLPGVIHLTMHGTSKAFLFNSPPSNEPVEYASLARYFGRSPSVVTTIVSTACFSARPAVLCTERGVCFASKVLEQGVSAAIGMVGKITPRAAEVFTENLYTRLSEARPIAEAYAQAVLAIKGMSDYNRLLWSIPIMYAKSSNVIPFPNQGYFDLLDRLENMVKGVDGLRRQLGRLPTMSRSDRIAGAGGLSLSMAAIRRDLRELDLMELPGKPTSPGWHKKLDMVRRRLDWQMSRLAGSVRQGRAAEQMSSMLASTLNEIKQLVADQYPIPVSQ